MGQSKGNVYINLIKRPMDISLALSAIIVLSPLLLTIALLVKVKLGSPILFKQLRPGFNEEIFTIYKFRTMKDARDDNGSPLPDSERLTKFGDFLRKTSLDELPELYNILKGDMSFVGPRPQLVKDIVFMSRQQRKRHSVLPGLTGWAQVNGRNNLIWEDKLSLDLKYIEDITFRGDWKIIFMTVAKVFIRDGISTEGMVTAEDFGDYLLREKKISKAEYIAAYEDSKRLIDNKSSSTNLHFRGNTHEKI